MSALIAEEETGQGPGPVRTEDVGHPAGRALR